MNAREILDFRLFDLAGTPISLFTLLTLGVILIATWGLSRGLQRAVGSGMDRRQVGTGTVGATQRLIHWVVMIIGASVALQTAGVNLSALFTAGAVFAVAIGFAMQTVVQNFVSGVILLVERSIKPGDILEVHGELLKVVDMRIRSTLARSLDEEDLIIPNSQLVQNTVKNFTLHDSISRLRAPVGVSYGSDVQQVFEVPLGFAPVLVSFLCAHACRPPSS